MVYNTTLDRGISVEFFLSFASLFSDIVLRYLLIYDTHGMGTGNNTLYFYPVTTQISIFIQTIINTGTDRQMFKFGLVITTV